MQLTANDRMFSNAKPEFYIDHNPEHGCLAPGKQFVLIQTQAAPADMYEALFSKCATIMRDWGVKNSSWLHCAGLWVDDMEGHAERLQVYAQQVRKPAGEVWGMSKASSPRLRQLGSEDKVNTMPQITIIITFLAAFFGLLLGMPEVSDACTSFAVFSNSVYYGMNFDFADVPLKFVIAANGDIRTFHLAFERTLSGMSFFVNTAGMNDKGLFAACQELHPESLHPRGKTETDLFTFELYDAIASCASVGEIETLCRRRPLVDMPGITLHNLFADTLGRAIVTEAGDNETVVVEKSGSFMVMTNFPIGSMDGKHYREAQGKGAERYITCHEYLDRGELHFNVENGFELLSMCRNTDPQYPTACSMVFDPQHRDVFISLKMDFSKTWKLSMDNNRIETWRGFKKDLNISLPIGDQGIAVSDLLTHAESQEG